MIPSGVQVKPLDESISKIVTRDKRPPKNFFNSASLISATSSKYVVGVETGTISGGVPRPPLSNQEIRDSEYYKKLSTSSTNQMIRSHPLPLDP